MRAAVRAGVRMAVAHAVAVARVPPGGSDPLLTSVSLTRFRWTGLARAVVARQRAPRRGDPNFPSRSRDRQVATAPAAWEPRPCADDHECTARQVMRQLPVDVGCGAFRLVQLYVLSIFGALPAALPPPRWKSRQRCLKMMMRPRADSYSGCQETRTYVRRSATYESRVGASRSVHTF